MGALETVGLVVLLILIMASLKVIQQYERGVRFTLGRYGGLMDPGLRFLIPGIQTYQKVDLRVKVTDVPGQDCVTKDNVSVHVNAVLFYQITTAEKPVLEVESYAYATSQLAQTTMRNVVGQVELDNLLSQRDQIAERIREIVDTQTEPWGIVVKAVELKDVLLPEEMKRIIAKQAEAERERRAVIIRAEGERIAAENLALAARQLTSVEGGLHLRTLNALTDLSSDQSNTVVLAIPIEILRAMGHEGPPLAGKMQSATPPTQA
jgi:regulator of protease activity HflC (stomatin/prohibitin superfamily)